MLPHLMSSDVFHRCHVLESCDYTNLTFYAEKEIKFPGNRLSEKFLNYSERERKEKTQVQYFIKFYGFNICFF